MAQIVWGLDSEKLASDFERLHLELSIVRREKSNLSYENSTTLYVALFLRGNLINRVPFRGLLDRIKIGTLAYRKYQDFIKLILRTLGYDPSFAEYEAVCTFLHNMLLEIIHKDLAVKRVITKDFPLMSPKEREEFIITTQDVATDQMKVLYEAIIDDSSEDFLVYCTQNAKSTIDINIFDKKTKQTTQVPMDDLWHNQDNLAIPVTVVPLPMRQYAVNYINNTMIPSLKLFSVVEYNKAIEILKLAGGIDILNQELLRQQESEYADIIKNLQAEGIVLEGIEGLDAILAPQPPERDISILVANILAENNGDSTTENNLGVNANTNNNPDSEDTLLDSIMNGTISPSDIPTTVPTFAPTSNDVVDSATESKHISIEDIDYIPTLLSAEESSEPYTKDVSNNIFNSLLSDFDVSLILAENLSLHIAKHTPKGYSFSLYIALRETSPTNPDLIEFTKNYFFSQKRKGVWKGKQDDPFYSVFDPEKHTLAMIDMFFSILHQIKNQLL